MISGWGRYIIGSQQQFPQTPDQLQWVFIYNIFLSNAKQDFLVLLQANVDIVNPAICRDAFPGWGPNQICTSDAYGDGQFSGGCQGDSGGPLSVQVSEGVYEVWGATSYGKGTCDTSSGTSGVWAMAFGNNPSGSVRSWIVSVTGGECPRS